MTPLCVMNRVGRNWWAGRKPLAEGRTGKNTAKSYTQACEGSPGVERDGVEVLADSELWSMEETTQAGLLDGTGTA